MAVTDDWQVVQRQIDRSLGPHEAEDALARLREREAQQGNLAVALDATIKRAEAAEARVARLEEALREIVEVAKPLRHQSGQIARRALAHEEEK